MSPVLAIAGAILVVVAVVDMLWTTVAASAGAGPVTSWLSHGLWSGARRLAVAGDGHSHRRLRIGGIGVVLVIFGLWIVALVLGWALVFASSTEAVVATDTGVPADFAERVYFAGYTTATLGNGEFIPGPGIWQQLTYIATFTGLGMATMAITYLILVTGAVTDRRTLALRISSLGESPHEILTSAWRGGSWTPLERELSQLAPELFQMGQRHLAYPVLHYFHDIEEPAAAAVAVSRLEEALTLMAYGVAEEARPHRLPLRSARNGVGSLLSALTAGHIAPSSAAPPLPTLEPLRRAGIPTVSDEEFSRVCETNRRRRQLLCGFLEDDGWGWRTLYAPVEGEGDEAADAVSSDLERPADGSDAA